MSSGVPPDVPLLGYVLAFALGAAVCFLGLGRVRRIEQPDVRRGPAALLLASGGWMASHVGYLAAPTWRLQYAFLVAGLVVGLAAVGTWLHSCSAYTGRTLHRNRTVRLTGDGRDPVVVDGDDHVHDSNRAAREPFPELAGVTGEPLAAVVPEVAEAHGWRVRAVEGTDGGARFEVTGVEFTG